MITMDDNEMTEIQEFYKNQTIFITGATGYLGTVLIEKLLRSCNDLDRIHVLIRPKRGKSAEQRLDEEIYNNPYFELLKHERPHFKSKLNLISGDLEQKRLGLSDRDVEILKNDVTCVINAASNVKFDQPLRKAAYVNVRAVQDLLQLAKDMPKLKSFVHISSVYSNCCHPEIKEEFYDPLITSDKLFALVEAYDDETLEQMVSRLVGKYHNTYLMTKCIGEDLIRQEGHNLPLTVIRPSNLMPTVEGPFPGWINNLNGVNGLTTGLTVGLMRTFCLDYDNVCSLVPCDLLANQIIVATWSKGEKIAKPIRKTGTFDYIARKEDNDVAIYNFAGSKRNQITWDDYFNYLKPLYWKYVSVRTIWYIFFISTRNIYWYYLLRFVLHKIPAYLIDATLILIRKKPIATSVYDKIDKGISSTNLFRLKKWDITTTNVDKLWRQMSEEDRDLFNFNMRELDWRKYIQTCALGNRVYLLNDNLETVSHAKRKYLLLTFLHYCLVGIMGFFLIQYLYRITMNYVADLLEL